ncbi:MAG: group II intron reverse transcriptase/maturase [Armatimonadota bacterium]|nr:group II intron reverse transcriptase/maturase [Armatimonadota bacterium]
MPIRKPLWPLIVRPEWLMQAWEEIRRNTGSKTAGVDGMTATEVDLSLIHHLARELKDGTYRPQPVRRVHIPKANGKTRPLGIPTLKDRIVQQALKMVLEPIYEADFLPCSHGFRQHHSTHTALKDIANTYSGAAWIIEGDITSCFDNIPHGKLLNLIGKRIADRKLLCLIRRFLKAGYLEDWRYHRTYSGTPQGGILSPLLANIFLHQLDEFMVNELEANRPQGKRESNARRNPEYRKIDNQIIDNQIARLRKRLKEGQGNRDTILEIQKLEKQRKSTPYYAKDKKRPGKVWYTRYADDFVILVAGTKFEAQAIKEKVKTQLDGMGLVLSEEKTKLTHWSRSFPFLGYEIRGRIEHAGASVKATLHIPQEKERNVREAIERVGGYFHIPETDVMVQMSAIYRGWCNYYKFATAPQPTFSQLASYTWWRYTHFLAKKQKASIAATVRRERQAGRLGKVRKGMRERTTYQRRIGGKTLTLDIFPPQTELVRKLPRICNWQVDLKPVIPRNWQSGRSLATRWEALERAGGRCEDCGQPATQVHHTRPLRGKPLLARIQSDKAQRTTATAVCDQCHLRRHGGSYSSSGHPPPRGAPDGRGQTATPDTLKGVRPVWGRLSRNLLLRRRKALLF